jgi:hypothetical protein
VQRFFDGLFRRLAVASAVLGALAAWVGSLAGAEVSAAASVKDREAVFWVGRPDGSGMEFGCARQRWPAFARVFPGPVVFTVGQNKAAAWPYIHPSTHDSWAGGKAHAFTIRFDLRVAPDRPLHLILGLVNAHPTPSLLTVALNGVSVASRRLPAGRGSGDPDEYLALEPLAFPVPGEALRAGSNALTLTLTDGSWLIYDYVYLGPNRQPPAVTASSEALLETFRAGPMAGVEDVIFAVRKIVPEHWYANFGYYASDQGKSYFGNANKLYRDGGRLCRLNLATGRVTTLLDDPRGGVRDPQVDYDAGKVLFSYRKGGSEHYHLYEINADGTGLCQLTDGPYDDIEPSYLPDGDLVFVSSRCRRWVNCWLTEVAVLYRCEADGRNLRPLSSNNEHDNTPWPLPDGRILYTRWEYVDRSQVHYHHLWVVNPDGTGQMVLFGNLHPGTVMIDAKPIPGSDKLVASFSPGHGDTEHQGAVTVVDPVAGPDASALARRISRTPDYRDPWAFSERAFLAARQHSLVLLDDTGATQEIFRLGAADIQAGLHVHEPRPLAPRPREAVLAPRARLTETTGRLLLANVYDGRRMAGVRPGDIRNLLLLESLPKPINYTGGMDPLSYGGTFTLERILGTVPVEADGSACFEVPALRSVFFVALDKEDLAVKRMQSFVTVQPGEVTGCVGCHEPRTRTPAQAAALATARAALRPPSRIEPVSDVPEVFDFPRDIQPVLDALCVACHDYEPTAAGGPRAGGLILSGDRGPMFSHSYYLMTIRGLFSDGRNDARSSYAPRALGSAASRILRMLDGSHHGVQANPRQKKLLRLWIETGAAYPGTYAALGSGMIGGYAQNQQVHTDFDWPVTRAAGAVLKARCAGCHQNEPGRLLPTSLSDERGVSFWQPQLGDPRLNTSRHIVFNLTRPEKSLLLLAPLARNAGGWELCRDPQTGAKAAGFAGTDDPDYQKLLALCVAGQARLEEMKRFDMPGFLPRLEWVREMQRYGVLPTDVKPGDPVDVYATEQRYWESLWYRAP